MDEARWRTVWDLKVFGYVNMTRRFCALMAARKKGVIINIIGAVGESVQSDYRLLRERLPDGVHPGHGWYRTPRRAAGRRHQPGPVESDRMTTRLRREAQAQFGDGERWREPTKGMTFGRAATPQEIAWMAAFLASDKSVYTTDKIITVDGGGTSRRSAL